MLYLAEGFYHAVMPSGVLLSMPRSHPVHTFVLPTSIAENVDGFSVIPRTPSVLLVDDPNWRPLDQIQPALEAIVRAKSRQSRRS